MAENCSLQEMQQTFSEWHLLFSILWRPHMLPQNMVKLISYHFGLKCLFKPRFFWGGGGVRVFDPINGHHPVVYISVILRRMAYLSYDLITMAGSCNWNWYWVDCRTIPKICPCNIGSRKSSYRAMSLLGLDGVAYLTGRLQPNCWMWDVGYCGSVRSQNAATPRCARRAYIYSTPIMEPW